MSDEIAPNDAPPSAGREEVAKTGVHKARPWHGVRGFLKEYVIIVVGVLTALAAGQIASSLDWAAKVREARAGLSQELGENLGKSEARIRVAPCIEQRLDALAAIVDQAARTGKLPALSRPGAPPYFSWSTGVWQSALSAETVSHMPVDELRSYARVYQVIARIEASGPQEEEVWTTLFGLAGPGRPFDAADARLFRQAIGQARTLNGIAAGFGVRARQIVDARHLPYDAAVYRQRLVRFPVGQMVCDTFQGQPPATYGASPIADFPDFARRNPSR